MSIADDKFKKLKFNKKENKSMDYIEYGQRDKNGDMAVISFDGTSKTIMTALYPKGTIMSRGLAITTDELEAILFKARELGWIEPF